MSSARFAALDSLLVIVGPPVGDREKSRCQERVNNGQQEDERGDQVEGLFVDAGNECRPDAADLFVTLEGAGK